MVPAPFSPIFNTAPYADAIAEAARGFYQRGWAVGTGGNFSAVVNADPLRLLITASGVDKGKLTRDNFVLLDEEGTILEGEGKPSAETGLHYAILERADAGAVLHTHSVWSTILSDLLAGEGAIRIEGFEMLKGLSGVKTHEHEEVFPILENSQDIPALANKVHETFDAHPNMHAFFLRRHGLTTWGKTVEEARRHVEIIEFLLETIARRRMLAGSIAATA